MFAENNDFLTFLEDNQEEISELDGSKWKVLIADDDIDVHTTTKLVLKDFVFDNRRIDFYSAYSFADSIKILEEQKDISLIFLDVVMEKADSGLRVVKYIREVLKNHLVRIILRTGQPGQAPERLVVEQYNINDYKLKTELTRDRLITSIIVALRSYTNIMELNQLKNELDSTQKEIIMTLAEVAEARCKETGQHVKRVAMYSKILAQKYGLCDEEIEMIWSAAPMHDIGKLAIPDNILHKPGKLTEDEFEEMKKHSKLGCDMLTKSNKRVFEAAKIISLQHHEKFDGTGYPQNLIGEEIHIFGRIVAIADVFDALGVDRVYKKAWEIDKIIEYFKEQRGKQFDPVLVDILLNNIEEILKVKELFPDD